MSATDAAPAPKPKGKKMLVIIIAVVLLLVAAGGGWFVFGRKAASEDGEEAPVEHAAAADKHKTPPIYLPMENMVVNLADPGGEKFAQIGITIETVDQKTSDAVKGYLPNIRSGVLMLVSQRTSEELLSKDGKEKLALDVLRAVSTPLGYTVEEDEEHDEKPKKKGETARKKPRPAPNPVTGILFSSFIIQ